MIRRLLALALAATAVFAFALSADEKPQPVPDYTYEVFFADTDIFRNAFGEDVQTSAPYVDCGVFYIPAIAAIEGIGGEISGDRVLFWGDEADISDLTGEEEKFLPAEELCERFGLSMRRYGGMLEIMRDEADIDSPERAALAEQLGFSGYEDRTPAGTAELSVSHIDPYQRSSYENVNGWIADLESAYPDLVSSFIAGQSVEGRDIYGFTMGRGDRVIYMEAAIHPSEYVTSNVIAYMADRYLAGYRNDERLEGYISYRELLDSVTFYFIPQVNPDGVNIVHNSFYASTLPVWKYDAQGADYPYQYKANANGVDLNRNFPYRWDPMMENDITWPCRRFYCGPEAASEPETRMVIDIMDNIPAEVFIDIHKFGETLNYMDSYTDEEYRQRYRSMASRLVSDSGFKDLGEEYIEFGGYAMNYNLHVNNVFSCTVEICRFYNYNENRLDDVVRSIWRMGLVLGEELLKLDRNKQGLRIDADGRTVPAIRDTSRDDRWISLQQLTDAVEFMGGEAELLSDGTLTVTVDGKSASRPCLDEYRGGDDLYMAAENGELVNLTHLFSDIGIEAVLDGLTARFSR